MKDGVNLDKITGILFISRGIVGGFNAAGFSKQDFKRGVWERSKFPWAAAKADFGASSIETCIKAFPDVYKEGQDWPICPSPDQYFVVTAGGSQSGHCSYLRFGGNSTMLTVSKPVRLPPKAQWETLLKDAEKDLGPIPVRV